MRAIHTTAGGGGQVVGDTDPAPVRLVEAGEEFSTCERMPGWARLLWFTSSAISQFYVFQSGSIQPFDYMLFLTCVLTIMSSPQAGRVLTHPIVLWLAAYVVLTWIVNVVWAGYLPEYKMLVNSLFATFNLIVFVGVCVAVARWRAQAMKAIAVGCLVSVSTLAVAGIVAPGMGGEGRVVLFFNNPNQMAAHCLATATILFVLRSHLGRLHWTVWASLPVFLWLALLTSSRAGILSTLILIVLALAGTRALLFGLLMAPALICTLVYLEAQEPRQIMLENGTTEAFGGRELALDEAYEERGYDRLFRFPEYIPLGAGEGAFWRFGRSAELHSSFGTILFSYGVTGTVLFLAFLGTWLRNTGRHAIFLLPMLSYGLTHQGLRQRLFWILLALTLGVAWLATAIKSRDERSQDPRLARWPSSGLSTRPVSHELVAERSALL